MKKIIFFLVLILCALTVHARAIREDYRAAEEKARVSYAFGLAIGANLRTAEMEFDYAAFTDGVRAALGDAEPQFTEAEAIEIIEAAFDEMMMRRNQELWMREVEFLTLNGFRPEVITTESGLQYEILVEADGERPLPDSLVRVHYTGVFSDGTIFDESGDEDGAYIPMDMVIPGWAEGVLLMPVGSTYRFYIPSNLAYGSNGIPNLIPPFSTLIFTVELLEIYEEIEEDEEGLFYY